MQIGPFVYSYAVIRNFVDHARHSALKPRNNQAAASMSITVPFCHVERSRVRRDEVETSGY